jgi:hypothetical protein
MIIYLSYVSTGRFCHVEDSANAFQGNLLYLLHESAFLAEHPWQPTQGAERPEIDLRSPIGWTKVAFQMEKLVHANLAQIHLLRADITPQMYTYRARLLIDGFVMVESATTFWKQEAIRGLFIAFNALAEKWGGGLRRWGRSNWGDTSS